MFHDFNDVKGCVILLFILLSTIENRDDRLIFDDIYHKYKGATMRRALKVLNYNHFDAEDAFQKAWIQISQNLDKIKCREDAAVAAYIMKTVEFKAIDVAKSNLKFRADTEPSELCIEECVSDDLFYLVCSRERYETIVSVLNGMDDKYKDIMILTYLHGFEVKSIAGQLGIKEKTVWTRLYRGKLILIEELKKRGIHNE